MPTHPTSKTRIARNPAHFRFWILDFRLSEQESKNRFQKVLFMQFLQSKIENRKSKMSFYDSVRPRQHIRRNRESDLFCRLEIYHQLELLRLLHRQVSRLGAFQDLVHICGSAPGQVGEICPVGYKATIVHKFSPVVYRRQPALYREVC